MQTYVVDCICGHSLSVEADSREEALDRLKMLMSKRGIAIHYDNYHSRTESVPSVSDVHAHIENEIREAVMA